MAFHVACPITCRRICYCPLGFPQFLKRDSLKDKFLDDVVKVEELFSDPFLFRVGDESGTVQVIVPKVAPMATPVAAEAEEMMRAQIKRVAVVKRAEAASLVTEDFVRRVESGGMMDESKDGVGDEAQLNVKVMCRLCFNGENEGSDKARKMLPCRSCGKKYHRSCVKAWSQNRDLFHWSSWKCPLCRICKGCKRTGDQTKFKFCWRCDGAYHCYCQQPPQKNVSNGPYLCPKHTKCHSCASTVPGSGHSVRWFLGYTCCDACGRLFVKGNYCPVCLKVYRDSEATPMVCCDVCQRWVHINCDGISDEKYNQFQVDGNLQYKCPTCRGECYQVRDLEDAVQELWRRKDEADRDLITSLRAAAGLPTQEEIFSISPYSDDDESTSITVKSEYSCSLKFSLKSLMDKSPKKNKDSGKKPSSAKSTHSSQSEGICATNQAGILKRKFVNEATADNQPKKPKTLQIKSIKNLGFGTEDIKPTIKNTTKLVIHFGGKNKNATSPPNPGPSINQIEQELTSDNAEKVDSSDQLKGTRLKGKESNLIMIKKNNSEASGVNPKSAAVNTTDIKAMKSEKVYTRKNVDARPNVPIHENNETTQTLSGLQGSYKDLKPSLKLKLKTSFHENQSIWAPRGDVGISVKGQRSKRKRLSSMMDNKASAVEDAKALPQFEENEKLDANWFLRKLGKDAIGKRVEVHQPSDDTWHKGMVEDIEGTSSVTIALDDGTTKQIEFWKQGIRFLSQKQKRSSARS